MFSLTFLVYLFLQLHLVHPQDISVCRHPADSGPCDDIIPRFFYNTQTHRCEKFVYGGCQGNDNKFETLELCQTTCITNSGFCDLAADSGWCKASLFRYYYDSSSHSCQPFTYGGCGGNENNFHTQTECQSLCSPPEPDVPSQSPVVILVTLVIVILILVALIVAIFLWYICRPRATKNKQTQVQTRSGSATNPTPR